MSKELYTGAMKSESNRDLLATQIGDATGEPVTLYAVNEGLIMRDRDSNLYLINAEQITKALENSNFNELTQNQL